MKGARLDERVESGQRRDVHANHGTRAVRHGLVGRESVQSAVASRGRRARAAGAGDRGALLKLSLEHLHLAIEDMSRGAVGAEGADGVDVRDVLRDRGMDGVLESLVDRLALSRVLGEFGTEVLCKKKQDKRGVSEGQCMIEERISKSCFESAKK